MPEARAGARAAPELQVEGLVERDGELQVGDQGRPCAVPHAAGRQDVRAAAALHLACHPRQQRRQARRLCIEPAPRARRTLRPSQRRPPALARPCVLMLTSK
jgi:hypothetical protein